ncbi:hypothetical protein [Novosphingobium cyanobacteriorum]|uniref:17 kDa surface antigen n=1 Tax=Novosphingobium cyanobacteriorum TaxID=3024215 RepID=A0ABT6CH14_9SPHN|nr:hypothetical protein [Novosphingobium cyanobacteriorum]MDF8332370.1 hypothetical protein [Novosphingobium cyanobacteriorum]
MFTFAKKAALATTLAATALATATPASARDYYGHHRSGGDTAGAAIAGGIIGLALGAIIASSGNNHRNDRYDRDGRYYNYNNGYYRNDRAYRNDGYRGDDRYDRDYYERRGYDGRDYGDYRRGY